MSPMLLRWALAGATFAALLLGMDTLRLFGDEQWLSSLIRVETQYYYLLCALLLPFAFLNFPRNLWLDVPLGLLTAGVLLYFFANAEIALDEAWEFTAPPVPSWAALVLWLVLLEALRRAAGWALFVIAGLFSLMPLVSDQLPGILNGLSATWAETASYHALSIESLFGLPFRAFAELVIGFVVFGVVLQFTGGGRFFLDLAFALLGGVRGGPAKVAIVSSGLMGSMSGSVVTNVLTTGQLTIPAMKKAGMSATVAGGVEACASTGGVLLPPIMGSTAFVMATLLEVPYYQVAIGAAIPSLLYFTALFFQIDAHAARHGLGGVAESHQRSVAQTLAEGWFYLGAFALLIFLLLVLQREAVAPYYATGVLLVLNQLRTDTRLRGSQWIDLLVAVGRLLVELLVILAGVGLIVGALSMTGLGGTLVNDLLYIADDDVGLLLLMGAATSFVLGIGMTVTAAYIFLAIVLAPALVTADLPALGVHLFILYWAMLSFITPPVALGAYAAASIAEANPIKTGVAAMGLGSIIYFLPFIFVLDPSFIMQGPALNIGIAVIEALLGIWLLAAGLQGYLSGVGVRVAMWQRIGLVFAGLAIALPDLGLVLPQFPGNTFLLLGGVLLAILIALTAHFGRKNLLD